MAHPDLPLPPHFIPDRVGQIWPVPYEIRAREAEAWAKDHGILPSVQDRYRICLMAVDVQNAFCIPGYELFVGARSGMGAVEDSRRLCEFIYRNLSVLTQIAATMDTHQVVQIFHSLFWINDEGEHPDPFTLISEQDVRDGRWKFSPMLSDSVGLSEDNVRCHLLNYTRTLRETNKFDLTIWPYHAMLGGVGHALVAALEEALFFHSVARLISPRIQVKGDNPLTERYSAFGPEVLEGPEGKPIAQRDVDFVDWLLRFDVIVVAGQAKSHCVSWTVDDLLADVCSRDTRLAERVYLLEDCTSPVVIPGAMDYTDDADRAFERFADAGMHVVKSSDPIVSWPGIRL